MAYSLYLIRNTRDTDLYYAEHGEIGGVPDAVGYDEPLHAMKFRTYEEAQAYIDTQLPEWTRDCHRPAELTAFAFYLARLWNYGYAPQRQAAPGPPAGADARPASSLEMLKEEKQMSQTPRNKMLTRMEEVRAQVAERDELIEIIAHRPAHPQVMSLSWAIPARPRAPLSTCSAPASPAPTSLSG